jgi:hypothetical protein
LSVPAEQYFTTQSPLVAAWVVYSRRLQYVRYDVTVKQYSFYDPDRLAPVLISDFNQVDPTVSLRRFHRTYKNLLAEKLREDGRAKAQRRAVAQ